MNSARKRPVRESKNYKWIALSNTTLGVLMAAMNASILIISLPAIFRGIHLNPLGAGNINYLLWVLMGYMVATAVLVVTFGRLGDMYGRAKMYNAGFAVFTLASISLALTPGSGSAAAMWMIVMRIVQGVGGALLFANSTAILVDAFPAHRRGLALGINSVAAIGGSFIGLIVGGLLADIDWRAVFFVSVPFGVFGTIWAYMKLHDTVEHTRQRIDVMGNLTFGVGLVLILIGINYGLQPYGSHTMAWLSPSVLSYLIIGVLLMVAFVAVELRAKQPMFDLRLLKIRAFAFGNLSSFLSAVGRGGLQFMLIIWLQGIWLPLHGYSFESTPLWAGIYMLPLTFGFLVSGPVSGWLSDRYSQRAFATGGMLLGAASFALLMMLPANFSFWLFAVFIFLNGVGSGLFAAPNSAAIMNSVPAEARGQASGMRATTMNTGMVLSIGIFFSLMIVGLAHSLPQAMSSSLEVQNVPPVVAQKIAAAPPVGSLFAAFLGYNPMATFLPHSLLASLPAHSAAAITGKQFFPHLISAPFMHGLKIAFSFSLVLYLLAALASWLRGKRYIHEENSVEEIGEDQAKTLQGALAVEVIPVEDRADR